MATIKQMAKKICNPIHSRIGQRIISIMIVLSTVVTLSVTAMRLSWDYAFEVEAVQARHHEIESIHIPLLAASLWEFDLNILEQKLEGLANLSRINYLQIDAAEDRYFAGTKVSNTAIINEYPIIYQSDYSHKTEILGTLRVESDMQEIYNYLIKQALTTLTLTALEVAILCFAILFVVHESINKRLFTVSQYLHNYDPQYPSSPLTLKSNRLITRDGDELYQLGDETNKITTRLTLLYNHIKYEQERFSDFANVASDWLWESNSEGVLIFASNEMKQALNIDSEQSLHFKDIPMLKNATNLLAKLEEKHSFSFCQETVVMNDISHYLLFHAIANYQHDRFIGYRGTAIDITVLQQVQIELEELNNTLEKKVADRTSDLEMSMIQLKETQQQLIESAKLAALGGLVSGVAHEVNTPLGISVTATSIIKEIATEFNQSFANQTLTTDQFSQLMSRMDASITMLESNLNRGAKLIRDFKQTAVDQVSESRCEFSVHQVLEALITSLHTETRKVPVKPKVLGNTELMMNSLPGVLTQVFTNLILNSVNHAFSDPDQTEKHPPEITISFRQEGELLHFDYHDNGSGIDHMLHQKIFEPFYTSKRGKGGSGLGLNLVFNLIHQKLQGQLIFDSALGEGVHFAFHLPIKLPLSEQEITD